MADFNIVDLIVSKRDGDLLNQEQIQHFAQRVAKGSVEDSQIGAMLMAIFLKGMNTEETVHLTKAMLHSGEVLSWPKSWGNCIGDKHSTGGVGDKVSLILAPALAACGVKVPMISGRGLGHTGGTLDKLESIPGFRVSLKPKEMVEVLDKVGCCIVGQNELLVPTDRVLYAIRDITGTVASKPLIASSIISKKAAESLSALVLDVKCGGAAFARSLPDARELAKILVNTAEGLGISCTALITEMDNPIGKKIGNSVEVAESLQCLHGEGPEDLEELVCLQGGHLLHSLKKVDSTEAGRSLIKQTLQNGKAIAKFKEMLVAQGVAQNLADSLCQKGVKPYQHLPLAPESNEFKALKSGIITKIDALQFATVCGSLGAGRQTAADKVNHGVGIALDVRVGDYVQQGKVLGVVYHSGNLTKNDVEKLQESVEIKDGDKEKSLPVRSRLLEVVTKDSSDSNVFVGQ